MKTDSHLVRWTTAFVVLSAGFALMQRHSWAADAGGAAGASATRDAARETYQAAMQKLVFVRQAAMKIASNEPDYRAAAELVEKTHAAYVASQKANANTALADPQYQELLKRKQTLEAELNQLQGNSGDSIEARAAVAQKNLELRQQMRAIEGQIRGASGSADLKKQWQEACKALEILQIKAIAKCEQVPAVAEAKRAADAADQAYKQAAAADVAAQASYQETQRQELKADIEQRRQDVINWNVSRYYNGGSYYIPW